ncbi:S-adenosyl-L-methionine-dependent methyltransferase [Umbelopsis sp. PMI_123]|nr:S-adenosyl-L-methionine-dependent methyltransferase [Umbelopsis sp. PMI_123]
MISTPDLSHLNSKDFRNIYEPAEDTFLLLDALEHDQSELQALQPSICLEIGSGSGCVTTFLGTLLKPIQAYMVTTDINPLAAVATIATGKRNGISIDTVETSLVQGLLPRLRNSVDILCFNPPYAVTPSSEIAGNGIEVSWAGGIDGREVIDAMLPFVKELLSENGVFYLLLVSDNKPDEVVSLLRADGFNAHICLQRLAGREKQVIVKVTR